MVPVEVIRLFEHSLTRVADQALDRWKLCLPKGWKLSIHRIDMRESDGVWHGHAWRSISLCLWGWYLERHREGKLLMFPGRIRMRPAGFEHQVIGNVAWTLILTGPRERPVYLYDETGAPESRRTQESTH